ncbi:MAG: cyclic nucleotide-binding/CBS domain-containing protein [Vicinamibacterales bacterium]
MRSVGDILGTKAPATVNRLMSVAEAARLMATRRIGALPVIDGDRSIGIFTKRDVLTRIVAAGADPARTLIGDVMSAPLVVADIHEECDVCLARMRQEHIRHLVILDGGRVAGVVTMRELMAAQLNDKSEAVSLLNECVFTTPELEKQRS